MSEDDFTTTLDAAEAFERNRVDGYRDLPDPTEYEFEQLTPRQAHQRAVEHWESLDEQQRTKWYGVFAKGAA